jgi:hypothetical protein
MSTQFAQVSTKPKVSDSGGEEASPDLEVFGAPASWSFGDILGIAGSVLSRNPRLTATLSALTALGVGLDHLAGQPKIIQQLVGFPLGILAMGGTYMTVVEGREGLTLEEVSSRYLDRVPAAFGTPLLLGVLSLGVLALGGVVCGAIHQAGFTEWAKVIGCVGFLCVLAIAAVHGQLLTQEVVIGGTSGREAISRSFAITKDQLGTVFIPAFGINFMTHLIVAVGLVAALIPGFLVMAAMPQSVHSLMGVLALGVGAFAGAVLGMWAMAGYALIYLRARDRA